MQFNWKWAFAITLTALIGATVAEAFYYEGVVLPQILRQGREEGFWRVVNRLKDAGLTVTVEQLPDGSYNVRFALPTKGLAFEAKFELHMLVQHFRGDELLSETYHPMSLTTLGKNWISDKIRGGNTNFMSNATYISVSNSSDSFNAAWTDLPAEITTDGLARATNSTTDTGDGTWSLIYAFSVSGTNSTKLYGVSYASSGGLVAAEQQGVGSQKNVESGDTLKITISGTVS